MKKIRRNRPCKDFTNKKFSKLTVINFEEFVISPLGKRSATWKCKCDCGNICIIRGSNLSCNITKSCGCLKVENATKLGKSTFKGEEIAGLNYLFRSYKNSAKQRNISFLLNIDEFKKITKENCNYCKIEPKQYRSPLGKSVSIETQIKGKYLYNGIDRVNNNIGYEINNCVPCCGRCNAAKNNMTLDEFKNLVYNIYNNLFKGYKK